MLWNGKDLGTPRATSSRTVKPTGSTSPLSVKFDIIRDLVPCVPVEPTTRANRSNSGQRLSTRAMLDTCLIPVICWASPPSRLPGGSVITKCTRGSPKPAARNPSWIRLTTSPKGSLRRTAKVVNTAINITGVLY